MRSSFVNKLFLFYLRMNVLQYNLFPKFFIFDFSFFGFDGRQEWDKNEPCPTKIVLSLSLKITYFVRRMATLKSF
jgi:hypothetical protein